MLCVNVCQLATCVTHDSHISGLTNSSSASPKKSMVVVRPRLLDQREWLSSQGLYRGDLKWLRVGFMMPRDA